MKKTPLLSWERDYQCLCQSLAQIGYISQGSVLDRSTLKSPRSGFQWTRKVRRKTITLALSSEQFRALDQAIKNRQLLQRTLRNMERLSRKILFARLPDTRRRKYLKKRTLGVI
jgi:hypothetical protein